MKFKIGDKVKAIEYWHGLEGVITGLHKDGFYIQETKKAHAQEYSYNIHNFFYPDHFILAEKRKNPTYARVLELLR